MRPVKIITDSTSDLSEDIVKKHNISVIPLYVNFGTHSFRDNLNINPSQLFSKVKETGMLPKTSAPTVSDFAGEFQKHIQNDMDILHISISSKISASYQNACMAAQQFPEGRVKVIDSLNLSTGIGILVLAAADCSENNQGLEDTFRAVQSELPKVRTEFIVDTVEYLHKGGRCSGLQMLLSNLLEIHPIIKVSEGSMHAAAKVRGNRRVVLRRLVKDTLDNIACIQKKRIFVTHCESADDAALLKKQITDLNRFQQVLVTNASCVISSHCGPKTIGIIYLES